MNLVRPPCRGQQTPMLGTPSTACRGVLQSGDLDLRIPSFCNRQGPASGDAFSGKHQVGGSFEHRDLGFETSYQPVEFVFTSRVYSSDLSYNSTTVIVVQI
jgi:hypothetical protein